MKLIKLALIMISLISIAAIISTICANACVTENWEIEYLGNPSKAQYPDTSPEEINARNVWDLQYFDGKIYIGLGDYNNNMGPVILNAFDCNANQFVTIGEITEEQISNFRIINDTLVIPGIDATASESHEFANWYKVFATGEIEKYRNLPEAAHCFDMIEYNGKIFAALGGNAPLAISYDGGKNFELSMPVSNYGKELDNIPRAYDLFVLNDLLYAIPQFAVTTTTFYNGTQSSVTTYYPDVSFLHYIESANKFVNGCTTMIDAWDLRSRADLWDTSGVIVNRKIQFGDYMLFINNNAVFSNDPALKKFSIIELEEDKFMDVIVRGDTLYLLGTTKKEDGWENSIYSTTDLESGNWEKILSFTSESYARSFELCDNGDWYFGIGCHAKEPHIQSGEIIRATLR